MSWQSNGNVIIDNKGNLICNLQKDIDPFSAEIIKNGDYAPDLMGRFTVDRSGKASQ